MVNREGFDVTYVSQSRSEWKVGLNYSMDRFLLYADEIVHRWNGNVIF